MNSDNESTIKHTITSQPVLQTSSQPVIKIVPKKIAQSPSPYKVFYNSTQKIDQSPVKHKEFKAEQKIDNFLVSTLYNHSQPTYPPKRNQLSQSNYKTYPATTTYTGQKITFNAQNPIVRLKPVYIQPNLLPREGMKLPQIIQKSETKVQEKPNTQAATNIQQVQKNQEQQNKCKKYLPWILGLLLLIGLILFLVLFIACRVHQNKAVGENYTKVTQTNVENQSAYGSNNSDDNTPCVQKQSPCPNQQQTITGFSYSASNNPPQTSSVPAIEISSNNQQKYFGTAYLVPESKFEIPGNYQNPHQLFFSTDHTNYQYLHLRRNQK